MEHRALSAFTFMLLLCCRQTLSFTSPPLIAHAHNIYTAKSTILFSTQTKDVGLMRLNEIREELKNYGVSYSDCFDRESLVERLLDTRRSKAGAATCDSGAGSDVDSKNPAVCCAPYSEQSDAAVDRKMGDAKVKSMVDFDRNEVVRELRQMRVVELRSECGRRNIRWATMFDKEDLVQALLLAREAASHFSLSGALTPGEVGEITGQDLQQELGESTTPILLDVYATWCGPCQQFAPHLIDAAKEVGDRLRVAKLDSDKNADCCQKLNVTSFPTLILFGADGQEIKRIEGAIMKPQLLQFVEPHI